MDVKWERACDFSFADGSDSSFSEEEWLSSESESESSSWSEEDGESGEVENVGWLRRRGCCVFCCFFPFEENVSEGVVVETEDEEEDIMGVRARSVRWRARWGC